MTYFYLFVAVYGWHEADVRQPNQLQLSHTLQDLQGLVEVTRV